MKNQERKMNLFGVLSTAIVAVMILVSGCGGETAEAPADAESPKVAESAAEPMPATEPAEAAPAAEPAAEPAPAATESAAAGVHGRVVCSY